MNTRDIFAELQKLLDLPKIEGRLLPLMMYIDNKYKERAGRIKTEDEEIILANCWKIFFLYSFTHDGNMKELSTIMISSIPEENEALKALCEARDYLLSAETVDLQAFKVLIHNEDAYDSLYPNVKEKISNIFNQHKQKKNSIQETKSASTRSMNTWTQRVAANATKTTKQLQTNSTTPASTKDIDPWTKAMAANATKTTKQLQTNSTTPASTRSMDPLTQAVATTASLSNAEKTANATKTTEQLQTNSTTEAPQGNQYQESSEIALPPEQKNNESSKYHYAVPVCAGIALAIGIAACCTGFLAPLGVVAIGLAISLSVSGGSTLCGYAAWSFFKKEPTYQGISGEIEGPILADPQP